MVIFLLFLALLLGELSRPVPAAGAQGEVAALQEERRQLLAALRGKGAQTPYIVIDTQDNRLLLREGEKVLREAACATGSGRKFEGKKKWHRWVFATPRGRFSVLRKVEDPLWIRPVWDFVERGEEVPAFAEDRRRFGYGMLGEYALYFARDFMIHGTLYEINLGKDITHGCVRLGAEDLRYLYDTVEVGWPVYIY
jgi:L,D-transpeptidase YbiS